MRDSECQCEPPNSFSNRNCGPCAMEAAEASYVGKMLDACETEEERIAITEYYAG